MIIERLLKLRSRQQCNGTVKSVLYLKRDRFFDLFSELKKATCPSFNMPQRVWDFWLRKILSQFISGDNLHVLGYEIRMLLR